MTSYLIALVVGFAASGLYNLGKKARYMEETDEAFFKRQLQLARQQCHDIATQFSHVLSEQRKKYLRKDENGNFIYDDWYKYGIEPFFHSKVSPRLIDAQRDCLVNYGNYAEIIDNVARSAMGSSQDDAVQRLVKKGWPMS